MSVLGIEPEGSGLFLAFSEQSRGGTTPDEGGMNRWVDEHGDHDGATDGWESSSR